MKLVLSPAYGWVKLNRKGGKLMMANLVKQTAAEVLVCLIDPNQVDSRGVILGVHSSMDVHGPISYGSLLTAKFCANRALQTDNSVR